MTYRSWNRHPGYNRGNALNGQPAKLIKKGEQKSYNCGYLFLQKIYYNLGLNKICQTIASKHKFEYDLNDILSKLVYSRILYPSPKLAANKQATVFLEGPSFELHDMTTAKNHLSHFLL